MPAVTRILALGLVALSLGAGASRPFATVTQFQNKLDIRLTKSSQWLPAKLGQLLSHGDRLRTGGAGRAEVSYRDGTIARIGPKALLVLDQLQPRHARLGWGRFLAGQVWLKIAKGQRAEIITPAAVATVVGTEFVLDVSEKQATKIIVLEGGVDFTGTQGDTVRVKGGFWGEAIPGKKIQPPQPVNAAAVQFAKGIGAPFDGVPPVPTPAMP
jgi:hypothetical protein